VEFSMARLAALVIAATGSKSEVSYAPLPADDPRQRKPDITKARDILGWEPKVPLEDGLQRTIEEFRGRV